MIDLTSATFSLKKDIESLIEAEHFDIETLSKETGISKNSLLKIKNNEIPSSLLCEKFYGYAYKIGYRFNQVKEEFFNETNPTVLFHGSKSGLGEVSPTGSRKSCDFGEGFYLSESYSSAISFVCENPKSCVYSFSFVSKDIQILRFDCSYDWLLAICYFRGYLEKYLNSPKIAEILDKIHHADLIIAPIADNRMFYIMSLFANGDITDKVALHSLSASSLGNQYIFKSDKGLNSLQFMEKLFVSRREKDFYIQQLSLRTELIESKLKLAKREFKDGLYIEELLG